MATAKGAELPMCAACAHYIQAVRGGWREFPESPANETVTTLTRQTEMGETMMVGLRLTQIGVAER